MFTKAANIILTKIKKKKKLYRNHISKNYLKVFN